MEKEESKGVAKKTATKKPATKKTTTKKPATKKPAAKRTTTKKVKTPEKEIPKINQKECIYCHKEFNEDLIICPHCNKNEQSKLGSVIIASLGVVLVLAVLFNFVLDKYVVNKVSEEEYKLSCELVNYEKLVRSANDYKNNSIKIIGKVVEVTGKDTVLGNSMKVLINANMFDTGEQSIIEVKFTDKEYKNGLINGDLITIYGEYLELNGNIPYIDAKYIVFGDN